MKNIKKLGLGGTWLGLCYLALEFNMPTEIFILLGLIGSVVFAIIFEL